MVETAIDANTKLTSGRTIRDVLNGAHAGSPSEYWSDCRQLAQMLIDSAPDSSRRNNSPEYIANLVEKTGLRKVEIAKRIGVTPRALHYYMDAEDKPKKRRAPYCVQFTLEMLARSK